jgi:predicted dehydrogenase
MTGKEERTMLNIAVIGTGYWGPNYVRVFSEHPHTRVTWCSDLEQANLDKLGDAHPGIRTTTDHRKISRDRNVDAVVITTPVNSHFELARYYLEKGKHVLMEKPFTSKVYEAEELLEIARNRDLIIMAGHIYLFHPAVRELRTLIKKGVLGKIYYLRSERMGLGPIRKHASALWDLATHDISMALDLLDTRPVNTAITGGSYIQENIPDFVDVNLRFPDNIHHTIYATWFAPEKVRKLTIAGSEGMAIFDDMNKFEPLRIFEARVDRSLLDSTPSYEDHQRVVSMGNVRAPKIPSTEPLRNMADHFIDCVTEKKRPRSSGKNGLDVIRILETADNILSQGQGFR